MPRIEIRNRNANPHPNPYILQIDKHQQTAASRQTKNDMENGGRGNILSLMYIVFCAVIDRLPIFVIHAAFLIPFLYLRNYFHQRR